MRKIQNPKELKLSRVSQDRSKNLTLEWSRIPASVFVMNHSSGPLTLGHVNIETTRCSTSQRRRAEGRILRHCLSYKNAACLSTFCSFFMTFSKVLRQLKLTNNVSSRRARKLARNNRVFVTVMIS